MILCSLTTLCRIGASSSPTRCRGLWAQKVWFVSRSPWAPVGGLHCVPWTVTRAVPLGLVCVCWAFSGNLRRWRCGSGQAAASWAGRQVGVALAKIRDRNEFPHGGDSFLSGSFSGRHFSLLPISSVRITCLQFSSLSRYFWELSASGSRWDWSSPVLCGPAHVSPAWHPQLVPSPHPPSLVGHRCSFSYLIVILEKGVVYEFT